MQSRCAVAELLERNIKQAASLLRKLLNGMSASGMAPVLSG